MLGKASNIPSSVPGGDYIQRSQSITMNTVSVAALKDVGWVRPRPVAETLTRSD